MKIKKPKVSLIDNWKDCWRFTSVQLSAAGIFLLTVAEHAPQQVAIVWGQLPSEITSQVPDSIIKWAGTAMLCLSPLARIIKQKRLQEIQDERNTKGDRSSTTVSAEEA